MIESTKPLLCPFTDQVPSSTQAMLITGIKNRKIPATVVNRTTSKSTSSLKTSTSDSEFDHFQSKPLFPCLLLFLTCKGSSHIFRKNINQHVKQLRRNCALHLSSKLFRAVSQKKKKRRRNRRNLLPNGLFKTSKITLMSTNLGMFRAYPPAITLRAFYIIFTRVLTKATTLVL